MGEERRKVQSLTAGWVSSQPRVQRNSLAEGTNRRKAPRATQSWTQAGKIWHGNASPNRGRNDLDRLDGVNKMNSKCTRPKVNLGVPKPNSKNSGWQKRSGKQKLLCPSSLKGQTMGRQPDGVERILNEGTRKMKQGLEHMLDITEA